MNPTILEIEHSWKNRWLEALELWSRYTRLKEPKWCHSKEEAKKEQLTGSFAMIRLSDHGIIIDLSQVQELKLWEFPLEIIGHEIGHHIYCPGDLADHARLIARIRRGLPMREAWAGDIANIYTDLLINNRLQRSESLHMDKVYQRILSLTNNDSLLWILYMRICELLWGTERGALAGTKIPLNVEGDAQLGARLVRVYSSDWIRGGGRFAALCFPYLLEDTKDNLKMLLQRFADMQHAGVLGNPPAGIAEFDGDEEDIMHPSEDPELGGKLSDDETPNKASASSILGGSRTNWREPFQYGEILKALGLDLSDHDIAVNYYRERAIPNLIPFPIQSIPGVQDVLPEGAEPWDPGENMSDIDWTETTMAGPWVIPGVTTRKRSFGNIDGTNPETIPMDLDLYVDCSGSMPNPQRTTSFLTLAGVIVALSALRVGARVQVTLWSGAQQFDTTNGFIRDEKKIIRILTGYLGGGTAFPIHVLRDTYLEKNIFSNRQVHILVISDDGVTTMFDRDERLTDGKSIATHALEKAGGGGTLCLNLYRPITDYPELKEAALVGWDIQRITSWEELVDFAKHFSRKHYLQKEKQT